MCGYVTRQSKMRSLQQVLAAIEASMPQLKGKLGKEFGLDAKGRSVPVSGVVGQKNPDGTYKNFDPSGKLKMVHGNYYETGGCHVVIPQQVFTQAGIRVSDGLGLIYDPGTKTWSMTAYDGDMRHGAFDEAFNSKVFTEYNKDEALADIKQAGCTQTSAPEQIEFQGKPALRVRWTKTIQVPQSVAAQMYEGNVQS